MGIIADYYNSQLYIPCFSTFFYHDLSRIRLICSGVLWNLISNMDCLQCSLYIPCILQLSAYKYVEVAVYIHLYYVQTMETSLYQYFQTCKAKSS